MKNETDYDDRREQAIQKWKDLLKIKEDHRLRHGTDEEYHAIAEEERDAYQDVRRLGG